MKELDLQDLDSKNKSIEIQKRKEQQKEYSLISSVLPYKNHKVYEINPKTLEVKEAEFMTRKQVSWWDALKMVNNPNYLKEIQINHGMEYITSLNAETALERFKKGKGNAIKSKGKKSIKLW